MAAPSRKGEFDGEVVERKVGRSGTNQYWRWNGTEWLLGTGSDAKKNKESFLDQQGGNKSYKQLGVGSATGSIRYPKNAAMQSNSDYVLFEFYKYAPPFKGINKGATKDNGTALSVYNQSATDVALYDKVEGLQSIVLYMPEDVSTGYKANWSGKAFSNIGAAAMATFGSGDFGQLTQNALNAGGTALDQILPNLGVKTVQGIVGKITGEQISNNDILSGTQGVILNPNVELLFQGIDLRNFTLNYKLVPRNKPEADNVKQIVKIFKKAMLPSFSSDTSLEAFGASVKIGGQNISNNFIQVPSVCKVSFMRGNDLNKDVTQYKMCAITQVDVNYTPDGAYATLEGGEMVAIGLSLSFQETKLIFANEVEDY